RAVLDMRGEGDGGMGAAEDKGEGIRIMVRVARAEDGWQLVRSRGGAGRGIAADDEENAVGDAAPGGIRLGADDGGIGFSGEEGAESFGVGGSRRGGKLEEFRRRKRATGDAVAFLQAVEVTGGGVVVAAKGEIAAAAKQGAERADVGVGVGMEAHAVEVGA